MLHKRARTHHKMKKHHGGKKHHSTRKHTRTHHTRRHLRGARRAHTMRRVSHRMMRGGMVIPKLPIFSPEEFNETVPYLPPGGAYVPGAASNSLTGGFYYGLSPDLSMPNGFLMNTSAHLTTPGTVQIGGSGLLPELKPAPLDASIPDVMSAIQAGQKAVADIEASAVKPMTGDGSGDDSAPAPTPAPSQ